MEVYDVVVVGAGSAGCVLAARLSEERSCKVLLLEAGPRDKHWKIHVPAAFSQLFKGPFDWKYETEPEPHLGGRRLYWPRGKVLGGSSSINAMIYIRGHRQDYDGWASLGNPGWSFADLLPYFRRAEDNARGASEYHGVGGPLPVSDLLCTNPLSHLFLEACQELGYPANPDFNGAEQEGVGFYQVTQRDGRRASVAATYLAAARSRPNLAIQTNAHATRIRFEGSRAVGVEYLVNGRPSAALAGEVVLCGGALNSPQLLQLSGVGSARQLEAMGVPVVHDLPGVGENLQDHPLAGVCVACSDRRSMDDAPRLGDLFHYLFRRRGRLTSNVGEAGAFLRTSESLAVPDMQIHFAPAYYVQHGFVRPGGAGYSLATTVLRPKSRATSA